MSDRQLLVLPGDDVGRFVAALEDTRKRTLALIEGLSETDLDRGEPNTIGSVLYHLAAIEADWLFDDVCGKPEEIPMELFPVEVREENGVLTTVRGVALSEHLSRLATIRRALIERISSLDSNAFHRPNVRADYDVSPAYVLHHLMQHEAEHRAEIGRALRK
jgi:uncharacterized damage-inducible protein DinB